MATLVTTKSSLMFPQTAELLSHSQHDRPWKHAAALHFQLSPEELIRQTVERGMGELDDCGALVVRTGRFTGRCPQHRYLVRNAITNDQIDWNAINKPVEEADFDTFLSRIIQYFQGKELWMRDAWIGASMRWRKRLRIITELPWADLFCHHLFIARESAVEEPFDWLVLHVPFMQPNEPLIMIHFTRRMILITGTAYTGEIKKGVFTAMNYEWPQEGVLTMHCAANADETGETALYFGLSGTGKTTLSMGGGRWLIGDDEHAWDNQEIFNLEGGCYAKCIHLNPDHEPLIAEAIRRGALLENVVFRPGTHTVDFDSSEITENTRAAFPLAHVQRRVSEGRGLPPRHIFLLTCDAHGVLPPVAKLSVEQALYYFLSGYTAKVAGTEAGVLAPKATFSACFGAPFIPLHPVRYAQMLGMKIKAHRVSCWLINTGWMGGPYGVGHRIPLPVTRAILSSIFSGYLHHQPYRRDALFGFDVPENIPHVPTEWLRPGTGWPDQQAYQQAAHQLAMAFAENFKRFADRVDQRILQAGPAV